MPFLSFLIQGPVSNLGWAGTHNTKGQPWCSTTSFHHHAQLFSHKGAEKHMDKSVHRCRVSACQKAKAPNERILSTPFWSQMPRTLPHCCGYRLLRKQLKHGHFLHSVSRRGHFLDFSLAFNTKTQDSFFIKVARLSLCPVSYGVIDPHCLLK